MVDCNVPEAPTAEAERKERAKARNNMMKFG